MIGSVIRKIVIRALEIKIYVGIFNHWRSCGVSNNIILLNNKQMCRFNNMFTRNHKGNGKYLPYRDGDKFMTFGV